MLPTFIIGLREGLEASLIVGIIAAFLRKQGRRDLLRWVWVGVATAITLCVAVGVVLEIVSRDLPQRQQEGLETVVGVLAVTMVTYMVVWMRRHSRELKGQLEEMASEAMSSGGSNAGRAMVVMAFLAVLREGFETVVFLLAAFNETGSTTAAGIGAVLGIVVASGLGYGIYRGGVRLNLSKFFRATGLVLVLVAAGLVVTALHTAHEAGWLDAGQGRTVDLTALVRPGSVQSSLLTGMLGVQQFPVVIEVVGWLAYLVPLGLYVAWPPGRGPTASGRRRLFAGVAGAAAIAAGVLALTLPASPAERPTTAGSRVVGGTAAAPVLRTTVVSPAASGHSATRGRSDDVRLHRIGSADRGGLDVGVFRATAHGDGAAGRPASLSFAEIARLDGGRLPIGLNGAGSTGRASLRYTDHDLLTVWLMRDTGRIVDLRWGERVTATVTSGLGALPLDRPVVSASTALPDRVAAHALVAARADRHRMSRRSDVLDVLWACVAVALIGALLGVGSAVADRRRRAAGTRSLRRNPAVALARH